MATEEPSRRKHHHSSSSGDDESAEDHSKRHRRRRHHHHRRRHHHHRHSSKRHDEKEANRDEDVTVEDKTTKHDGVEILEAGTDWRPNYDDMEEGEIVEDEAFGAADDKAAENCENPNMRLHEAAIGLELNSALTPEGSVEKVDGKLMKLGEHMIIDEEEDRNNRGKVLDEIDFHGKYVNGHSGRKSYQEEDGSLQRAGSPVEWSGKRKSYYEDESERRDYRTSLSSDSTDKRHKTLDSSSYDEDGHKRNSSMSRDPTRGRSRSQSIFHGIFMSKTGELTDSDYYTDKKHRIDSDEERMTGENKGYRHGSQDLLRHMERSLSYSRHSERRDRHSSRDIGYRDKGKSHETWDGDRAKDMDRDRKREKDRELEWERARDWDKDREREREDRSKDRERWRERGREKEREREREKEMERDREREKRRDSDRRRDNDRDGKDRKYDVDDGFGGRERYDGLRNRGHDKKDFRDRSRNSDLAKVCSSKNDSLQGDEEKHHRDKDEQEDYQERISLQLAEQDDDDLDRIKEESRRRTQAILEKYKTQQLEQQHGPSIEDTVKENAKLSSHAVATAIVVSKNFDDQNEGIDIFVHEPTFSVGKSLQQNGVSAFEKSSAISGLGEGTPKSERSNDMFCDDIFGESPSGIRKTGKGDGLAIERSGLHDNWDDADQYYCYRFGEILDGRYEVTAAHGKGVFSTVVRAKDLKAGPNDPDEVAIKIIRNNDTMLKAGMNEQVILEKLVGADPDNRRHCVRFISHFKYRNHLCLVFESMHMNLREVSKKYGRNIGISLVAVQIYAKQLFIALKHLKNCGVLHCDIKPDNMLVNESHNVLKLCDFGNAMFAGKNEITPYLVSRFYRAPEIILGLPYDHPMDIWSIGCCLYELYAGKVLFPGATNNDMLRLHMELKGPFPKKMLRRGAFTDQHFDHNLNFLATEEDPVTKKTVKRLMLNMRPKDIGAIVSSSPGVDPKMFSNFKDLLDKIFVLDPDKRITVLQALNHPFITGK